MEFKYSRVVASETYLTDGLAFDVPLRIHEDPDKAISGALKAQRDWNQQVAPLNGFGEVLAPSYNLVRVILPECLPDRLEILSYAIEFAFLYDDEMEKLELKNSLSVDKAEILGVFNDKSVLHHGVEHDMRAEKRLQSEILKKMMSIDPVRSVAFTKAWATYVQLASRTRIDRFETLAECMPNRVIDIGELLCYGTVTFGMALTIPGDELDVCFELAKPGYAGMGLVNDMYSWKREKKAAEDTGQDYIFNAIWVVMKESSVSEDEVFAICREKIAERMTLFIHTLENLGARALSKDTVAYLEAVRYSYIGSLVWSINCPRYHEWE